MADSTERTRLFLSYSRKDAEWRERFMRHLLTVFPSEVLWVDKESIEDGAPWVERIAAGLSHSRCAMLLVTPAYLRMDDFARKRELPLLLAEQTKGLRLLPVLVEFTDLPETLARLQLVHWNNDAKDVTEDHQTRERVRALSEAGDDEETQPAQTSAIERAIVRVCEQARRAMGVIGQITDVQRDDLYKSLENALKGRIPADSESMYVALEPKPLQSGDYTIIYKGVYRSEDVIVKALPTSAWRNRVGKAFKDAHHTASQLLDRSFIRTKDYVHNPDFQALVMEYIDWPTLHDVLASRPERTLPPLIVARILEQIARAQDDAHEVDAHRTGMQVGALSPAGIHVNHHWKIRLAPVRIEAYLARAMTLSTGQLMNWDVMTMLTPEVYAGRQPMTKKDFDAHEQYYLGLLALELLNGRRPVEVAKFEDLQLKSRFFDDPRSFFGTTPGETPGWIEECPSMAYLLARMLARSPAERLESADEVANELRRIKEGHLPISLRRSLVESLPHIACEAFSGRFYPRLFAARSGMDQRFPDKSMQFRKLADTVKELVNFHDFDGPSPLRESMARHRSKNFTKDDIDAFRHAFVAEVVATSQSAAHAGSQSLGDAWNAVLKMALSLMMPNEPPTVRATAAGA